jgi:N-sulfoglucosamine sulfohydrolase
MTQQPNKKFCFSLPMLAVTVFFASQLAAAEPRPNVLLIVSEDNGPELGCYGDPFARTPVLDQLALEGVRFDRAFVAQSGCSQSRASFLTGLYPHQHGQIGLATWGFLMYREDTPNVVRSLKNVGYRTGIIGKLHINPESAFPFDFHQIDSGNFARKNIDDYARYAKEFFTSCEEPFFLSVNYPDAHHPWLRQVDGLPETPKTGAQVRAMPYMGVDPPEMREMVADYYNCISRLDSLVGDLLQALEDSGKAESTLVIYIGDHGADMLRGKRTCYEGGLLIPLIIRWPGVAAPQVRKDLVSTVDLVPTILEAAGSEMIPGLPGLALQPLLVGQTTHWREYLFSQYHTHATTANYHPQRAVRNDRFKLIENLLPDQLNPDYADTIRKLEKDASERGEPGFKGSIPRAIANAAPAVRAAYALMEKPPRYELYDLHDDPYEFHNLANNPMYSTILLELTQVLDSWRRETGDPLLDPKNLRKLTEEVQASSGKKSARQDGWRYPQYFFGIDGEGRDWDTDNRNKKSKKRDQ